MFNHDIRTYAKEKGVKFWQIAYRLGISEPTMTRRLRFELTNEQKQEFKRIINEIATTDKNTTND
jgi:hypothetical protein